MFRTMSSRLLLAGVLLVAVVMAVCLAEEIVNVNINPYKIVLNAQGAADDVQANVSIGLSSALIPDFDVTLSFDGIEVAKAESARYCLIDNMLIIGFDREELLANPNVIAMGNSIVKAKVAGTVTDNNGLTKEFSGSDMVEIVAPGKSGK
jgi:hypothetical protein